MFSSLSLCTVLLGALAAAPATGGAAHAGAADAPDFLLSATDGSRVSLYALPYQDQREFRAGVVLAFLDAAAPQAAQDAQSLGVLAEDYLSEGLDFVVVSTSPEMDAAGVQAWADQHQLPALRLLDPTGSVARAHGVHSASEMVLLDAALRVAYRGALDDRFEGGEDRGHASEEWLAGAIECLLAEEEVSTPRTDPTAPARASTPGPLGTPNFHQHVAPILHQQCATCHREGQIGPMALLDFEDARGWAPMIAEVVEQGQMPPWHADSRHGQFQNARRLTETEKDLLARWAQTGAIEGDAAKAAPAPSFASPEWRIGTPDLVVQLPRPESVPATGVVDYRYIVVDPQLTEDRWVQAVEVRPTAPEVTHHALVLMVPPGMSPQDAMRRQDFLLSSGHFAVNVPGQGPAVFEDGYAIELKAGTRFLFQMHYTPNGAPAEDQTRMAMRWHQGEVEHPVLTRAVINPRLNIPPRTADVQYAAEYEFETPVRLLGLFPHMHARGQAFRVDIETAFDRSTILDVPRYDFNWQHTYYYREPMRLAAGTRLHLTALYDNSENNPRNPDPDQRVRWGDQTWEEMLVGYVTYVEDVEGL